MIRKKDNYNLWLKEIQERHRIRNAKRRAKRKAKKNAIRTWKPGCLITFKTLDACRNPIVYLCRMKKIPDGILAHSCYICRMINHDVPCLKIMTNTYSKCMLKRPLNTFPLIVGKVDKHGKYYTRNVSI